MRVVQINSVCGQGSTGKICVEISKLLSKNNIENYILYSEGTSDYPFGIRYSSDIYKKWQALKSRIFGNYGFNSTWATKKLIKLLDKIKPDIVQIHNIHGHDCNLDILFTYLKQTKVKLVWTFHDCWAFTGYCPHFTLAKCDKWKTECRDCPQFKQFSWFIDKSSRLYQQKKELFHGLDMTIVSPSQWLGNLVKQSFLKDYPVNVISNSIDLSVFKPTPGNSREKYHIVEKYIVLGVAFGWGEHKGLDVFIDMAYRLSSDYRIVLVGTDDVIDKQLPDNIVSIHRTQNQQELAELYTAANVFVNPTREEVFGLVNLEALACGTPVITFKTGGSPEMLDATCGTVVTCDENDKLVEEIKRVCENHIYPKSNCILKAKEYDMNSRYKEYLQLYRSLCL